MPGTQAFKRKKTADMTDSPPKRVTRARAKTTTTDDVAPKPKTTRITTASAKVAATKKKPAVPPRPIKRKTRADDEPGEATDDAVLEEAVLEQEAKPEPTKDKGRLKKDVTGENEETQIADAPKTRARPTKATTGEVPKPDGPKLRGRPKKALEAAPTVQEAQKKEGKPVPAKKTTRGRPVVEVAATQSIASASRPAAAAPKKRVKFQQELDKENVPIEVKGLKSAMKPTGLKAKPVRKPVAARASTRGRKAAIPSAHESQEIEKKDVLPLSPKKATQVAKSDPVVSEDELAGAKTPIRALSKSPAKRIQSPAKDFGSVSKSNFGQVTAPSSPSKVDSSGVLASPARRLPPSPFKDALKVSPKRLQLGDSMVQPVLLPSRTPMKVSLLQVSPRRGNFGDNTTQPILLPSNSPLKTTLLQESPRRGNFRDSTAQPILLPSKSPLKTTLLQESPRRARVRDGLTQPVHSPPKSPFKTSLLQSPARRPPVSPTKSAGFLSPVKSGMKGPELYLSSKKSSPAKTSSFSSDEVASSPFRASSPKQTVEVNTSLPEEGDVDAHEEHSPAFHAESSIIEAAAEVESPLRSPMVTLEEPVPSDDTVIVDQSEIATQSDDQLESSMPAETPTFFKGPAFSLASAALRRVSIESGSEDELASPDKTNGLTPLRKHGVSAHDFGTPVELDAQDSDNSEDQLSFTPLANQLSSWTASTPNNRNAKTRPRQARGMFSLGGAGLVVAPESVVDDFPSRSPGKSSFFEDEMAMRDSEDNVEDASIVDVEVNNEQDLDALRVSQESQASEEYGDENAIPSDAEMLRAEQDLTLTCTPAKVFTPAKKTSQQPREIHTVSKVPLRASAEDSPLIVTRQRSRSLGGPLSVVSEAHQDSARNESMNPNEPATPMILATRFPQTPGSIIRLDAETPGQSARKVVVPDVLKGAVVFVDVHTSEGADASGIFVDLLTQMGARCVKQWSWNPRASMGSSLNGNTAQAASPDTTRVGITHVVYKDGGKRTLEKVRSSNGVVMCVGVGWVLE